MKYDDAKRHYGGDFPQGVPPEYGGTHIALFLRWCFIKGLASPKHMQGHAAEVQAVVAGTMPATTYLFQFCDGALSDEDLSPSGNAFASRYYGKKGMYLFDYVKHFSDLMYRAPESEHNLNILGIFMEARLRNGILTVPEEMASKK